MALTNIITNIFQQQKQVKLTAAQEYKKLLHKYAVSDAEMSVTDQQRMGELLAELGKDEKTASEDVSAVKAYYEHKALAEQLEARKKATVSTYLAKEKAAADRQKSYAEQNELFKIANTNHENALNAEHISIKAAPICNL